MSQLVEPGRGSSNNLNLLRPDVAALPQCLPGNSAFKRIKTTLRRAAPLTGSVMKGPPGMRRDINRPAQKPLMFDETAHNPFPESASTQSPVFRETPSTKKTGRNSSRLTGLTILQTVDFANGKTIPFGIGHSSFFVNCVTTRMKFHAASKTGTENPRHHKKKTPPKRGVQLRLFRKWVNDEVHLHVPGGAPAGRRLSLGACQATQSVFE
jgi:hypothetical protein